MRSRCWAALWYASGVVPLLPCSARMSSSMVTAPPTSSPDCTTHTMLLHIVEHQQKAGFQAPETVLCLPITANCMLGTCRGYREHKRSKFLQKVLLAPVAWRNCAAGRSPDHTGALHNTGESMNRSQNVLAAWGAPWRATGAASQEPA